MANFSRCKVFCSCILLVFLLCCRQLKAATLLDEVAGRIFSPQGETLRYTISWSGGIKIGDLSLNVRPLAGKGEYAITARVTDYGAFHLVYPVDDSFVTLVRGLERLPYRYEVLQREGWGKETRRLTLYDQAGGKVRYQKNTRPEESFSFSGTVHNEFSSFYYTRILDFHDPGELVVPTFADKKNNLVKVLTKEPEVIDTRFGRRRTIPVLPLMRFKGLYDKAGDTTIWFGDDPCRIPYRIRSEILIGSLTADLVALENPLCGQDISR